MSLKEVLLRAYEEKASDIHLMPERPVMFRKNGRLCACGEGSLQAEEAVEMVYALLSRAQRKELEEAGELEAAVTAFGFLRVRVNAYRQKDSYAAVLHLLTLKIPEAEALGLPPDVLTLAEERKGLLLIDGESGCGKTTTIASLLSKIAAREEKSIITIEAPVEYLLPQGKSLISQREVSGEAEFAAALRKAMRQNADVIFVERLCDAETISLAVTAAEMGCLVFSSLHIGQTEYALHSLLEPFAGFGKEEMRRRLSNVLRGVVTQQLLPRCDREGRSAVFEILRVEKEIRNLLREGRFFEIRSVMESKGGIGMQTMDDAILSSYMKSEISAETAVSYALDKEEMQKKMKIYSV